MTTEIDTRRSAPARANWGRWVADCSTPWCTNAWSPELDERVWLCSICGLGTEIEWPPDPVAIEVLLLMRPDPKTRSWEPGETLGHLMAENVAHGIVPEIPGIEGAPVGTVVDLLSEVGMRCVGGLVYGPIETWREVRPRGAVIALPGDGPALGA